MDWWHATDQELWQVCKHLPILDYVQAVLGPDFYLWGSQFFSKEPGDRRTTPDWLSLTSSLYWKRATTLQFHLALSDRG